MSTFIASQRLANSFIKLIFVSRKLFEAYLISSAASIEVTTIGSFDEIKGPIKILENGNGLRAICPYVKNPLRSIPVLFTNNLPNSTPGSNWNRALSYDDFVTIQIPGHGSGHFIDVSEICCAIFFGRCPQITSDCFIALSVLVEK